MFFSRLLSGMRYRSAIVVCLAGSILCLAVPAVGLGWILRQYCARGWNHRDRWAGVWVLSCISLLIYGLLAWRLRLFPVLLISIWQETAAHHFSLSGRS